MRRLRGLGLTPLEERAIAQMRRVEAEGGFARPAYLSVTTRAESLEALPEKRAILHQCFAAVMLEMGWTQAEANEYLAGGIDAFLARLAPADAYRFRVLVGANAACCEEVRDVIHAVRPDATGPSLPVPDAQREGTPPPAPPSWFEQNRTAVLVGGGLAVLGAVLLLRRR